MDKSKEKERVRFDFEVAEERKQQPIWKNSRFAAAVVAVVCVIATVFGAHRSVAAQGRSVEKAFYNGVDGTGYSISELLEDRAEYADKLVALARQYDDETLLKAAEMCGNAAEDLRRAAGPEASEAANRELTNCVSTLNLQLQQVELSELHERYRSEYVTELTSYNQKISHLTADYNALVREFNEETLGGFPLGTIARLTGVEPAEEYNG